ncbi:HAMP domain-containing histidine kinase [Tyzzerella sp. OttesenSCG-928-J15]|nr:HAMP domain-containing histidine kinase [Tyzzerella sp. OttesenSCG-928-J15]
MSIAMAAIGSRRMLQPVRNMIDATRTVAEGDFSVHLDVGRVPDLEELNASFNKMDEELGSIETLRSDFVSSFSHEFKTPIVSIRGFAKLLKDKELSEDEREEYTDIIITESERLTGLDTNILNLSKLENIGILTDKEQFHLDEQIRRVAAFLEPRWKEKRLDVKLQMEPVKIYSDAALLQRVWMNLFDNAIKFTSEGGHIVIILKKEAEQAVFTIEDDGCGMDEATLSHLFDKFYQSDKSRSGAGNGLGLSFVHRAVTLCEGKIAVESTLGKGSRFTIKLPIGKLSNV